jgi:hypothetical protein
MLWLETELAREGQNLDRLCRPRCAKRTDGVFLFSGNSGARDLPFKHPHAKETVMSTNSTTSAVRTLTVTVEEASELLQILEQSLSDTRVEMHHTHTPDFRDKVHHREDLLRGLIAKFRALGA